jgi:16S rRNA (uracil1498-N3)-methyltransferase
LATLRHNAPRFYVDAALAAGAPVDLPAAVDRHARAVLRLRAGDPIVLFNGHGGEYAARLGAASRADVERFDAIERESPLDLTLVQALISMDKLDWVIEKAVELGATRIVIAATERSVIKLDGERLAKRLARWRDLVIAACCQCGRNRLPALRFAADLKAALAAADGAQKLLLTPRAARSLSACAAQPTVIVVGPEGGFSATEEAFAQQQGFTPVGLGPRVLRTETAGLAALAALQAWHGDGR